MEIGKIKPEEAAAILHVSVQYVRVGLQQGVLGIGSAVKMSTRWSYHISPKLLEEYSGANVEEELGKLRSAKVSGGEK